MSKERCCCGCIHTGALIIGSLVLIFAIIGLLASVVTGNVQGIVSNILGAIIGGCIVYADRSHKPGGYLPYLIFAAIGIVIYTVFIVFVVKALTLHNGTFYTQSYDYETQHNDSDIDPKIVVHHLRSFHRITCEMIFFMAAVMAFVDWIAIWFWMVVYRAYQYMKGAEEYDRGQTYQVKHNDV